MTSPLAMIEGAMTSVWLFNQQYDEMKSQATSPKELIQIDRAAIGKGWATDEPL